MGHFDGHGDHAVGYRAHHPLLQVRTTLDAIGLCHRASIHPVHPQRTTWSSILAQKIKLWHCEIAF